jgi:hypothetical protein
VCVRACACFKFVCMFSISFFHFIKGGVCLHPFLLSSLTPVRPGSLRRGPLICRGIFYVKRNFLFCLYCSSLVIRGIGYIIPSPSETDFEDAVSSTTPFFRCCASGSFRTLTVPCESSVQILYPVLFIAARESRSMSRISLWPFG